ncbi:39S ribosomal protein L12, mitochondrial [Larimichthys crocea]|uniref:Uncharacterized protein n=1 Tax=Larimichthys crocea TaxID=215358 RepID=A0ACD3R6K5_LARCR|nr:39S ribosomal protein L12, mitochondrial [Larimichthys crocea]
MIRCVGDQQTYLCCFEGAVLQHKPVQRLFIDVGWLPGNKGHLLGKAYDMLPSTRAQLYAKKFPVGLRDTGITLTFQHVLQQTLPPDRAAGRSEHTPKTLNIQDVGMMPMSASAVPAAQAVEEEEAPAKKEQTHFTVKLTELKAADKVKLIKEVKNCIQGLNLVQSKKLVESLPQEIRANVSKEEAEKLKAALEAAGGTVVLE